MDYLQDEAVDPPIWCNDQIHTITKDWTFGSDEKIEFKAQSIVKALPCHAMLMVVNEDQWLTAAYIDHSHNKLE